MLFLSKEDIKSCFSVKDAIASVETAFVESFQGNVISPLRTVISAPGGTFLFMAAYATEICRSEKPKLLYCGENHQIACHNCGR